MTNIKNNIRVRMAIKNRSTRDVAKMGNISHSAISYFLANETRKPNLDTLEGIAKGLDCKISDLFIESLTIYFNNDDVLKEAANLAAQDQEYLKTLIDYEDSK